MRLLVSASIFVLGFVSAVSATDNGLPESSRGKRDRSFDDSISLQQSPVRLAADHIFQTPERQAQIILSTPDAPARNHTAANLLPELDLSPITPIRTTTITGSSQTPEGTPVVHNVPAAPVKSRNIFSNFGSVANFIPRNLSLHHNSQLVGSPASDYSGDMIDNNSDMTEADFMNNLRTSPLSSSNAQPQVLGISQARSQNVILPTLRLRRNGSTTTTNPLPATSNNQSAQERSYFMGYDAGYNVGREGALREFGTYFKTGDIFKRRDDDKPWKPGEDVLNTEISNDEYLTVSGAMTNFKNINLDNIFERNINSFVFILRALNEKVANMSDKKIRKSLAKVFGLA